ncbi:hypothetical protein D7B24_008706 [Verticillium nonalfalfae]|uniref:Zn(2)-C6 fungal-type domain-containing protein n=1 Tax=Verticillium nonalfalfae TaxID=1051616 RepID=A0A3M9YIY7_9PEZI|nr:uncharacterized protein D7B24_008706 [Verticillium nonalfalfae]RNJ60324.1 hypothetical protein D7B24_008706 [Verticillium nonalfalfae]
MAEVRTELYVRRTLVVPASVPKDGELSSRKSLAGPLRLSVHDYSVLDANPDGATFVLTHGNSYNKYFWELIINLLLKRPDLKRFIKRFIAIDAANHGDSAMLNRGVLPVEACWHDVSRDILSTIEYVQAQKPVIGIGHSYGGGGLCHAAMLEPTTFLATILVEPILFAMEAETKMVVQMALRRRDTWKSKADVTAAFQKSKGFRSWDRRQLQVYLDHGIYAEDPNDPSSPVHLATPKEQEAASYIAAPHPVILELIEKSKGRNHFIWGGNSEVVNHERQEHVARLIKPPSTSQVMAGADHALHINIDCDIIVVMDSDKQQDSAKASSIEVMTTTDRVDHGSKKPERRLSHSTDASKNSNKKSAEKRADDRASPDSAEQPAKKMKRGKYISRACTSCQQRKVKCDGGEPCAQCIARDQPCVSAPKGHNSHVAMEQRSRTFSVGEVDAVRRAGGSTAGNASTMELLARLAEVEHRLNMIPTSNFDAMLYKNGQTFAGEISMSPGLQGMDDDMDRMAADSSGMMAEYPSRSPNPALDSSPRKIRAWLEAILDQHGVVADEEAWRRYLHIFLEEIHILYPILHAPTLWETFNEMWEYSALWPLTSSAEREQKRMAVALSAGWTLYSVGMSLLQDSTEMSNTAAKSLLTLQMLLIRVIYLFRLDATQRATRLLALAVSNAHIIGLHRQSTLENMPAVASQMYTRSWWSIYVLDRRLAIESGRPYLIQDSNVDTALPLDLSDAWLTRFQSRPEKISQLQREVALELASEPITAIPYIAAMVRYSRVVGKAWELLYGVKSANSTSSPMVEYADTVLTDLLDTLPPCLTYDLNIPNEVQFASRLRWQVKQTVLLYTCTHFLRLLMRRPFSSHVRRFDRAEDDEVECATVCASLAARILNVHESIQDDTLKYCFPFSHYLTSSTMIMMGLFTREPSLKRRHRATVLAATRSLNTYCHRIWVSGKMMRWVQKLTSLVQRTFKEGGTDRESSQRRDSVSLNQEVRGDDMQQLTPHSDQAIESENGIPADFQQTRLLSGLQAGKQALGGSPSWSFGTDGQGPNLPDWAMSDFNFETIIAGEGSVQRALQSGDLATIPENGSSTMKISNIDLDESMFGSLGPNGIFNLDMDMEQATLGLFSPDMSRYA